MRFYFCFRYYDITLTGCFAQNADNGQITRISYAKAFNALRFKIRGDISSMLEPYVKKYKLKFDEAYWTRNKGELHDCYLMIRTDRETYKKKIAGCHKTGRINKEMAQRELTESYQRGYFEVKGNTIPAHRVISAEVILDVVRLRNIK